MRHREQRMDGWRGWVHLPWHCPACILFGTALGFGITVILVAVAELIQRAGR